MNKRCNQLATEARTMQSARPTKILLGGRAMLTVRGVPVTTKMDDYIRIAMRGQDLRVYLQDTHKWSNKTTDDLAWEPVKHAMRRQDCMRQT